MLLEIYLKGAMIYWLKQADSLNFQKLIILLRVIPTLNLQGLFLDIE